MTVVHRKPSNDELSKDPDARRVRILGRLIASGHHAWEAYINSLAALGVRKIVTTEENKQ